MCAELEGLLRARRAEEAKETLDELLQVVLDPKSGLTAQKMALSERGSLHPDLVRSNYSPRVRVKVVESCPSAAGDIQHPELVAVARIALEELNLVESDQQVSRVLDKGMVEFEALFKANRDKRPAELALLVEQYRERLAGFFASDLQRSHRKS